MNYYFEGLCFVIFTFASPIFMYYAYDIIEDNFLDSGVFEKEEN
jgi:hypothetical protein